MSFWHAGKGSIIGRPLSTGQDESVMFPPTSRVCSSFWLSPLWQRLTNYIFSTLNCSHYWVMSCCLAPRPAWPSHTDCLAGNAEVHHSDWMSFQHPVSTSHCQQQTSARPSRGKLAGQFRSENWSPSHSHQSKSWHWQDMTWTFADIHRFLISQWLLRYFYYVGPNNKVRNLIYYNRQDTVSVMTATIFHTETW